MNTNYDFSYFKSLADKQYEKALSELQRLINHVVFLEKLYSFVGNCIYDDSAFIIEYHDYPDEYYKIKDCRERLDFITKNKHKKSCIRKINDIFDYNEEIMSNWEPILLWVEYDNENATQNVDYILSAIKFMKDQEKCWRERYKKLGMEID